MKEKSIRNDKIKIINEKRLFDTIIYQEAFVNGIVFTERYLICNKRPSAEILMYVGLNILPETKYFGYFPFNLCKETNCNISVVYEAGCSGKINRHFRRFTQEEAQMQYLAGLEIVRNCHRKVIIFSHSASTIEHLKLIFKNKYINFCDGIHIAGGIVSATATNILLELKRVWPNYSFFNWKIIMQAARFFDIPLPVYPYFNKSKHANLSTMNNLSIWINSKTAELLLSTNIKKTILGGNSPGYHLLVLIPKYDRLFSPKRQETLANYMSRKAKITVVKCDAEHNLFLSDDASHILEVIKEYVEQVCSG